MWKSCGGKLQAGKLAEAKSAVCKAQHHQVEAGTIAHDSLLRRDLTYFFNTLMGEPNRDGPTVEPWNHSPKGLPPKLQQ